MAIPAIWIESGRPIFYLQKRVGKGGQIFRLIKLRTMQKDAEQHTGASLRNEIDRTTRVGRILRELKIDEIPQLVNILKGDMNLVGPRPERPIIAAKLMDLVPDYGERFKVRPGLTGPGQLYTPYDTPKVQRLKYDLHYVDNRSAAYDTRIILGTIAYMMARIFKFLVGESIDHYYSGHRRRDDISPSEKNILLFQNDLLDTINLKTFLRDEGYAFLAADDLNDIYHLAKTAYPDLIICELFLDNPEHIRLCKTLKNNDYTVDIPIMILTRSRRKEDNLVAGEIGVDEYVTKPITNKRLKEIIREVLLRSEAHDLTDLC